MKIFCKHCNNQLTSELAMVTSSEDAYETVKQATEDDPFEKSAVKSGCLFSSRKARWWEENDQDSGEVLRYIFAQENLTGAKVTNESKGCCKFDDFDLTCDCGAVVGYGQNDCWQVDMCSMSASKTYIA